MTPGKQQPAKAPILSRARGRLAKLGRRLLGDYARVAQSIQGAPEPYFRDGLESFAVLLKGRSIEKIDRVYGEYDHCFIVNNFDREIELLEPYLINKRTVHFVNRLMTAPLTVPNYRKLGITDVQLSKATAKGDDVLRESLGCYVQRGLRIHFLPASLLRFNRRFGVEYRAAHPNTGVLAVIYALDVIRPTNLWVVGLDFYQHDYLARRPHVVPLEQQRARMRRLDLVDVLAGVMESYPEVNVNLVTYYEGFPELENVTIL
jgi:hypothetical protein